LAIRWLLLSLSIYLILTLVLHHLYNNFFNVISNSYVQIFIHSLEMILIMIKHLWYNGVWQAVYSIPFFFLETLLGLEISIASLVIAVTVLSMLGFLWLRIPKPCVKLLVRTYCSQVTTEHLECASRLQPPTHTSLQ